MICLLAATFPQECLAQAYSAHLGAEWHGAAGSATDLACFQSNLAASLTVAGGTLGAHALRAAHSSLCPSAHAAFCAAREEYLANLHPEHLQQIAEEA